MLNRLLNIFLQLVLVIALIVLAVYLFSSRLNIFDFGIDKNATIFQIESRIEALQSEVTVMRSEYAYLVLKYQREIVDIDKIAGITDAEKNEKKMFLKNLYPQKLIKEKLNNVNQKELELLKYQQVYQDKVCRSS
jgi:hypothetical protein